MIDARWDLHSSPEFLNSAWGYMATLSLEPPEYSAFLIMTGDSYCTVRFQVLNSKSLWSDLACYCVHFAPGQAPKIDIAAALVMCQTLNPFKPEESAGGAFRLRRGVSINLILINYFYSHGCVVVIVPLI